MAQSAKEFADWRRRREREIATLRRAGVRQQAQVPWFSNPMSMDLPFCMQAPQQLFGWSDASATVHMSFTVRIATALEALCKVNEVGSDGSAEVQRMECIAPAAEARIVAQVHRLEAVQAKQAAVLRRKTEEADAARRRLKARMPLFAELPSQD